MPRNTETDGESGASGGRSGPVEERVVRLELDGYPAACWSCTAEHLDALAAGWLLSRGLVRRGEDIAELRVEELVVHARVRAGAGDARDATGASGARIWTACDPRDELQRVPVERVARVSPPPLATYAELLKQLYARAVRYSDTGGIHVAGLADRSGIVLAAEDVGRHNAVDKVLGLALLRGSRLPELGLVLSARISGEIALKGARAGVAWIASRSVPTTLALAVAAEAGLPLIARAGGRDARIYPPGAEGES